MVIWHLDSISYCLVRVTSETLFSNLFDTPPHTPTMAENESFHGENDNQQLRTM